MVGVCLVAALLGADAAAAPVAVAEAGPLTLAQAVRLAQSQSESARDSELELAIAAAELRRARAAFFPELTVSGQYSFRPWETVRNISGQDVVIRSQHGLNATLSAAVSILEPRAIPAYRQMSLAHDAALLEHDERLRRLGFAAAEAFFVALGADAVAHAALARVEIARQTLAAGEQRQRAGLSRANEVTRLTLELATAERNLAALVGEQVTARHNLELITRAQATSLVEPTELVSRALGAASEGDAQGKRLDVEALARRAESAEAGESEPLLRYLPSLAVASDWTLTNEPGLTGRSYDGYVGVRLSWKLFDRGIGLADDDIATARAERALLSADAQARRAALEVRAAQALLVSSRAGATQAQAALSVARRHREETAALYGQGLVSALDLADASQQLFEAEAAAARSRYGALLAHLDLWAALGQAPEAYFQQLEARP